MGKDKKVVDVIKDSINKVVKAEKKVAGPRICGCGEEITLIPGKMVKCIKCGNLHS